MNSLPPRSPSSLRYKHTPFENSDSQIRLLKILTTRKDSRDTPILIDVQTFDLETAPPYIALSYEWGTEDNLASVLISDRTLPIRRNLHDFLVTCISCQDLEMHFWIDQISIDQQNVDERNQQVMRMAEIFITAEEVISWLGVYAEPEGSIEGLSFLSKASCNPPYRDPVQAFMPCCESHFEFSPPQLSQLHSLAKKSYWKRLWIAQEIVLAKTCWVMYGPQKIPLGALVRAIFQRSTYSSKTRPFDLLSRVLQVYAAREQGRGASERFFVDSVMRLIETSCCTDPRDKLYGIQSILPKPYRMVVDYRLGTQQTFIRIATSYTVISITNDSESLPSWICGALVLLAAAMGLIDHDSTKIQYYTRIWFGMQSECCISVWRALRELPAGRLKPFGLSRDDVPRRLSRGIVEKMLNVEQDIDGLGEELKDLLAIIDKPPYSDEQLKECGRLLSQYSGEEAQLDSCHDTD